MMRVKFLTFFFLGGGRAGMGVVNSANLQLPYLLRDITGIGSTILSIFSQNKQRKMAPFNEINSNTDSKL